MGRIRTIKPEILSDAKAAKLSHPAWRLWVSCWLLADDEGRLPADPEQLHGQVFWGCPADIHSCLAEIQSKGLAMPYIAKGDIYLVITNFRKHQRINRPSGPKFPEPESYVDSHGDLTEDSVTSGCGISISTATATNDREGEREGGNAPSSAEPTHPEFFPEGTKPGVPVPRKRKARTTATPEEQAIVEGVLLKLSERAGVNYRPTTESYVKRIVSLLRKGYSERDLRLVIWHRWEKWGSDPKMEDFLRPKTLFGPDNFAEYLPQAEAAWAKENGARAGPSEPAGSVVQQFLKGAT